MASARPATRLVGKERRPKWAESQSEHRNSGKRATNHGGNCNDAQDHHLRDLRQVRSKHHRQTAKWSAALLQQKLPPSVDGEGRKASVIASIQCVLCTWKFRAIVGSHRCGSLEFVDLAKYRGIANE